MTIEYFNKNSLVLLGGLLGILSVFLYYISPSLGSWWYLSWEIFKGEFDININAFGYDRETQILESIMIFVGIFIIIGSILAIIGGMRKSMKFSFISSLIMLTGIVFFLSIVLSTDLLNKSAQKYGLSNIKGTKALYGNTNHISWGLGIGFYLALIATLLVLIVSMTNIIRIIIQKRRETKIKKLEQIYDLSKQNILHLIKSDKVEAIKTPNS